VAESEQEEAGRFQRWREKRRLKREARHNSLSPLFDPTFRDAEDAERRSWRDHRHSGMDQSGGAGSGGG